VGYARGELNWLSPRSKARVVDDEEHRMKGMNKVNEEGALGGGEREMEMGADVQVGQHGNLTVN